MTDQQLSPHFKLSEFLHTDNPAYVAANQQVTTDQVEKLRQVALLGEQVRSLLGGGLHVNSGYRCPQLNAAIGSSARSQHLLAEAMDFHRFGQEYTAATLDSDFRLIMAAAKAGQLRFGQLIQESAKRYNGVSLWIHISLGAPWRAAERSGQCLTMSGGVYTMVYHV